MRIAATERRVRSHQGAARPCRHSSSSRSGDELAPETRATGDAVLNEKAIRDRLAAHHVSYVTLTKESDRSLRSRLGENPEKLTDLELLNRYLLDKRIPDLQREVLLTKALELIGAGS